MSCIVCRRDVDPEVSGWRVQVCPDCLFLMVERKTYLDLYHKTGNKKYRQTAQKLDKILKRKRR